MPLGAMFLKRAFRRNFEGSLILIQTIIYRAISSTNRIEKIHNTNDMNNSKECNKCNEVKELNEFNNLKKSNDGKSNRCRKCTSEVKAEIRAMNPLTAEEKAKKNADHKKYMDDQKASMTESELIAYKAKKNKVRREWRQKNKGKYNLNHYVIYALPNYTKNGKIYCGLTKNPINRMCQHRFQGRNTDNWVTLATAKTKKEGLIIEKSYHGAGYAGYIHENRTLESYKQNKQ